MLVPARLIGLIGRPIDKARVVLGDEYGPLRTRQVTGPLFNHTLCIDIALASGLSIRIGASIHRIGEHVVDSGVGGSDPADLAQMVGLQRKGEALGAKP